MVLDIFESTFRFPNRVYILAPGPNGVAHWDKLGDYIIGVSKAIQTRVPLSAWLLTDWWALKTPWFPPEDAVYKGVRIFSDGLVMMRPKDAIPADYRFALLDGSKCTFPLGTAPYGQPVPRTIRPDGSVSASAVELVARLGAKEIVLCGVDMYGASYFDGEGSSSVDCPHIGEWAFTPYFNSLIEWVREQGIDVWSMSKTSLGVDVRES